jgi:two-component system nitrogen regulation response regulator GlnG
LQSVLKQAILHANGPIVLLEHLPRAVREASAGVRSPNSVVLDLSKFVAQHLSQPHPNLYARSMELVERTLIALVLRHTLGNQTAAADLLGITRGSLRFKIRALAIDVEHAARTGEPGLDAVARHHESDAAKRASSS